APAGGAREGGEGGAPAARRHAGQQRAGAEGFVVGVGHDEEEVGHGAGVTSLAPPRAGSGGAPLAFRALWSDDRERAGRGIAMGKASAPSRRAPSTHPILNLDKHATTAAHEREAP